jgi:hypothetical protein
MPEYQGFFTIREMRQRGWRIRTIAELFKRPSKVLHGDNQQIDLYNQDIVTGMETDPLFERIQAEEPLRPEPAVDSDVNDLCLADLYEQPLSREDLRRAALHNYNLKRGRAVNTLMLPPAALEKIEVDYLFSMKTKSFKVPFRSPVRVNDSATKDRVLSAIAKMYPHLKNECQRRLTKESSISS